MSVFIMDPITITTYNLHGFNQGKVLLPSLCKCSDIILIQEHWLYPDELYKLDRTDDNFVSIATSAMQIKTVCGPHEKAVLLVVLASYSATVLPLVQSV